MAPTLKVYGWTGFWLDDRNSNRHGQARFLMAAHSRAEVYRTLGRRSIRGITETGNKREIETAIASPLSLFAYNHDIHMGPIHKVEIGAKGVAF